MKAADAVVSISTGGRHLSSEQKGKAGPLVHYAFGALMGALYGTAAEYASRLRNNLCQRIVRGSRSNCRPRSSAGPIARART